MAEGEEDIKMIISDNPKNSVFYAYAMIKKRVYSQP
jgi:hypothetical protein